MKPFRPPGHRIFRGALMVALAATTTAASPGGDHRGGTIFRLTGDGAGSTVLRHLNRAVEPAQPSSALIEGAGPLSYPWQKDGAVLPGATSKKLHFKKVSPADAGIYRVGVTNADRFAVSEDASLMVK